MGVTNRKGERVKGGVMDGERRGSKPVSQQRPAPQTPTTVTHDLSGGGREGASGVELQQ